MKKTLVLALTLFSCFMLNTSMSAQSSTSSEVVLTQNERFSNGTVTEITANTVKAVDNTTGEVVEFTHPGAQVILVVGDLVSYRLITFPNGKPPVVIEVKRPS